MNILSVIIVYTIIIILHEISWRRLPLLIGGCIQGCREYDQTHWAILWWINGLIFTLHILNTIMAGYKIAKEEEC